MSSQPEVASEDESYGEAVLLLNDHTGYQDIYFLIGYQIHL